MIAPAYIQASNLPIISDPNYPIQGVGLGDLQLPSGFQWPSGVQTTQTQTQYQWSTQYVTTSALVEGQVGAWCKLDMPKTVYNIGEIPTGYITSNRPNRQFAIAGRLSGEADIVIPITETTDAAGNRFVISPMPINTPGIYDIGAGLIFGPTLPEVVPCTPTITKMTVNGLGISAPDSVMMGGTFQIDVYSGTAGRAIEIQQRQSSDPVWHTITTQTTNTGGHYSIVTSLGSMGNWVFRAYDRGYGILSNEEWVYVGI